MQYLAQELADQRKKKDDMKLDRTFTSSLITCDFTAIITFYQTRTISNPNHQGLQSLMPCPTTRETRGWQGSHSCSTTTPLATQDPALVTQRIEHHLR